MSSGGKDWPTIDPDRAKDDGAAGVGGHLGPALAVPHLVGRRSCGEKLPKLDGLEQ
jgi:hypothetical protein